MIAMLLDATSIAIGTAALLLVAGGIAAQRLLSPEARQLREQRRLHDQLATANRLSAAESDALWRLARAAKLAEPAVAFVRPSLLTSGGGEGVGSEVLAGLRTKLFAP